MDTLQQDIVSLRKELGWSQQKLADTSFLSQNTISQYETGARKLSTEMFLYLLSCMGVQLSYTFKNEKGEKLNMKRNQYNIPSEPIDCRSIRSEEGFRLWSLQQQVENIYVDVNDAHFIVYKKDRDGAIFWLALDTFDRDALLRVCQEEEISYEEI